MRRILYLVLMLLICSFASGQTVTIGGKVFQNINGRFAYKELGAQGGVSYFFIPTDTSASAIAGSIAVLHDTVFYARSATRWNQVVGGGGSGNTNSNLGTAFQLAVTGTNNLKTIRGQDYALLDTLTSGEIRVRVDTAGLSTDYLPDHPYTSYVDTTYLTLNGDTLGLRISAIPGTNPNAYIDLSRPPYSVGPNGDASAATQLAVDSLFNTWGGGTVLLPYDYNWPRPLIGSQKGVLLRPNVHILGIGNTLTYTGNSAIFSTEMDTTGRSAFLTADVDSGATVITVDKTTGFTVGDTLYLFLDDAPYDTTTPYHFGYRTLKAKDATHLTLDQPLPWNILIGGIADAQHKKIVSIRNLVTNASVENLKFVKGVTGFPEAGIYIQGAWDFKANNVSGINTGAGLAVFQFCKGCKIENSRLDSSDFLNNANFGRGLSLAECEGCESRNNTYAKYRNTAIVHEGDNPGSGSYGDYFINNWSDSVRPAIVSLGSADFILDNPRFGGYSQRLYNPILTFGRLKMSDGLVDAGTPFSYYEQQGVQTNGSLGLGPKNYYARKSYTRKFLLIPNATTEGTLPQGLLFRASVLVDDTTGIRDARLRRDNSFTNNSGDFHSELRSDTPVYVLNATDEYAIGYGLGTNKLNYNSDKGFIIICDATTPANTYATIQIEYYEGDERNGYNNTVYDAPLSITQTQLDDSSAAIREDIGSGTGASPTLPSLTYPGVSRTTSAAAIDTFHYSIFNVQDKIAGIAGAIADSSTDAAPGIQAKIDYISTHGGRGSIFIPGGVYKLNSALHIPYGSHIEIYGSGAGGEGINITSTKLVIESTTQYGIIDSSDNSIIHDFGWVNVSASPPTAGAAIKTTGFRSHIYNVSVNGFYYNIEILNCTYSKIINCALTDAVNTCLKFSNDAAPDTGDMLVLGCNFSAVFVNTLYGIYQTNSGGLKVIGCKFNANAPSFTFGTCYRGYFDGAGNSTSDIAFDDATSLENFTVAGFWVSASNGADISNISIDCQISAYQGGDDVLLIESTGGIIRRVKIHGILTNAATGIYARGVEDLAIGGIIDSLTITTPLDIQNTNYFYDRDVATSSKAGLMSIDDKILSDTLRFGSGIGEFLKRTGGLNNAIVADSFNISNTADIAGLSPSPVSSGAWQNVFGGSTIGVNSNEVYSTSTGTEMYVVPTSGKPYSVSTKLVNASTTASGFFAHIVQQSDYLNYIYVLATSSFSGYTTFSIGQVIAGVGTTIFTGSGSAANGDSITTRVNNDSVFIYQNSTLLGYGLYNAVTLTGTNVGVEYYNNAVTTFDNFIVKSSSGAAGFLWGINSDPSQFTGLGTKNSPLHYTGGGGSVVGGDGAIQYDSANAISGNAAAFYYDRATGSMRSTKSGNALMLYELGNINPGTAAGAGLKMHTNGGDSYIYRVSSAYSTGGDVTLLQSTVGDVAIYAGDSLRIIAAGDGKIKMPWLKRGASQYVMHWDPINGITYADTTAGGSGTVTSVSAGTGMSFTTITDSGAVNADTTILSTRLWRQKGVDSINTLLALKATIASPTLTGTPAAPTASTGTNTTQIATTAFVANAISSSGVGNAVMFVYGLSTGTTQTNTYTNSDYVTPNDATTHYYNIQANAFITAISAGTLTVSITYTDPTSTTRTATFFNQGATAAMSVTGATSFPPMGNIPIKDNTSVTISFTFAGVSISYSPSASITRIF